jgi:hypothetical protein
MVTPLNTLKVEFERQPKECRSRYEIDGYTRIVLPDGQKMQVSQRFWNSFCSLENLSRNVFDYFTHEEVFDRITQAKGHSVRLAVEANPEGTGQLLSG